MYNLFKNNFVNKGFLKVGFFFYELLSLLVENLYKTCYAIRKNFGSLGDIFVIISIIIKIYLLSFERK